MEEEILPVTSYLCQWKIPKSRKESTTPISEAVFVKHQYSKPNKRKIQSVEEFDPRPPEFRGTASERMPQLLEEIRGDNLCVSLLFDSKCRHWDAENAEEQDLNQPSGQSIPTDVDLTTTMSAFKDSLSISETKAREIERSTRQQQLSPLWFSARRNKITASKFGRVMSLKRETKPDNLVMEILQPKQFSTVATRYGINNESIAIQEYVSFQNTHGHPDLTVSASGFIIDTNHPFLGASPDGTVYDPSDIQEPFGFVEIKCPYTVRNQSPVEACSSSGFFCTIDPATGELHLKESSGYHAQIQGQMGIGIRPWCDFVVYTKKGLSIERILFNPTYWNNKLLPKLKEFYDCCILPEIVSPIHATGLPVRDLRQQTTHS